MKSAMRFRPLQILAEFFSMAFFISAAVWLSISYTRIPAQIPSHYNAAGTADSFTNKSMLLVFIIAEAVIYLAITVVSFLPRIWNFPMPVLERDRPHALSITRSLLCSMKLILTGSLSYIIFCTGLTKPLSGWFYAIALAAVIISLGFYLVRSFRLSLNSARQSLKQEE